jgi:hypothetical protein
MFVWLISHQSAVLFSRNKSAISNQPTILFSQNKPAPAISHQPTEEAVRGKGMFYFFSRRIDDIAVWLCLKAEQVSIYLSVDVCYLVPFPVSVSCRPA